MAVIIFSLLSIVTPEEGRTHDDEFRNGLFSTIAFVLGALTSILSGYLGMKIATFANARTALEARKGIAPAFMCGESQHLYLLLFVLSLPVTSCVLITRITCCHSSLPLRRCDGLPAVWPWPAVPLHRHLRFQAGVCCVS